MNKKKDAVGYIRVSTLQQVESGTSLEEQKSIIEKEAKHRDLNLIKIYSDEGISGKSIVRPGLSEMLDDSKQGKFDTIFFTKLDRLARNLRDTLNIFHQADELGIDLICIDNPAISTNGPMGSVMLSVLATFAQFERELIRSRTTAGRIRKWKSGESIMGHLPFGYKKNSETGKIEVDKYKCKIINKIFDLYLIERLSMIDVADRLTQEGYKTPSALNGRKDASNHWNMNTVREILTNRCYTGEEVTFNKFKFIWNDKNALRKTDEEKPHEEWIVLSFPKIIEENRLNEVQQKITYNRAIPKRTIEDDSEKFLTLHLLRCGSCHAKLSKQTSGTKKYLYYACPWKRCSEKRLIVTQKKRCNLPFLKYEAIDKQVFNQVIDLISNPHKFTEAHTKTVETNDLKLQIDNLQKDKEELKEKIKRIINIETNTSDAELLKMYQQERSKVEEKFTYVNNNILKLTNDLSFYDNRQEQLDKFKLIFPLKNLDDKISTKKKIKKMLNDLPFNDKKKLLDAVISPETGGCVYISPLSAHHLSPDDVTIIDNTDEFDDEDGVRDNPEKNVRFEQKMVIELDFTLDPVKITQIIQSIYDKHFTIDKLLFYYWESCNRCC